MHQCKEFNAHVFCCTRASDSCRKASDKLSCPGLCHGEAGWRNKKITCNDLLASQGLYDSGHISLYQVSMPKLPSLQKSSQMIKKQHDVEKKLKTAAQAFLCVEEIAHEEMSV